jgi:hypothetical protein
VESVWWLVLLVLPLASLAGIMLFAVWLTRQVSERMISHKHRLLEEIVNTGEVPAEWLRQTIYPVAKLRGAREAVAGDRAKTTCLQQLDDLTVYVERSPFMADDETREVLLERLDHVYEEWATRNAAAFRWQKRATSASQFVDS